LDSLVSTAIQVSIHILSPDPNRDTREGPGSGSDGIGSTSGVSTVNSLKSHKVLDYPSSKLHAEYQEQLEGFRLENDRLLQELLDSRKAYQLLLKSSIDEQKLNLHLLNQASQQMRMIGQFLTLTPPTIMRSSETGFSSHHTLNSEDDSSSQAGVAEMPEQASSVITSGENSSASCCHHQLAPSGVVPIPLNIRDPKLVEFLTELHLDRISIEKFLQEEYTYDDVVLLMTRDDLKALKLKGGIELRVWKSIVKQRRILDPEGFKSDFSTDL